MSILKRLPEHLRVLFEKEASQVSMRSRIKEWELYEQRLILALKPWMFSEDQPNLIEVREIQDNIARELSYPISQCRQIQKESVNDYFVKGGFDSYEYDCYEEEQLMAGTKWALIGDCWKAEQEAQRNRLNRTKEAVSVLVEAEHIPYALQTKGQREITDMENEMFLGMAMLNCEQTNYMNRNQFQGERVFRPHFHENVDDRVKIDEDGEIDLSFLGEEDHCNLVQEERSELVEAKVVPDNDYVANNIVQDDLKQDSNERESIVYQIQYSRDEFEQNLVIKSELVDIAKSANYIQEKQQQVNQEISSAVCVQITRVSPLKKTKKRKFRKGVFPRVFSQLTFVMLVGLCCVSLIDAGEMDWTCFYEHHYTLNSASALGPMRIEYYWLKCAKQLNGHEWVVRTHYERHKTYVCDNLESDVCFPDYRSWYMHQADYGVLTRPPNIVTVQCLMSRDVLVYQGVDLGEVDINGELTELAEIALIYHNSCVNGEEGNQMFDRLLYYPQRSGIDERRVVVYQNDGGVVQRLVRWVVLWVSSLGGGGE